MTPKMNEPAVAIKLLALIRSNIVLSCERLKLISDREAGVGARLDDLSAIDTSAAAMERASLKECLLALAEEKINLRFSLKESGRTLLNFGSQISATLEPGALLEALRVDPKDFEGVEICGGNILHTIFAHGLENSDAVRGLDFIAADLQPLTWQFNLAMVDWMCQTNAGNKASNEVWEQTFGPVPDEWKQPPTMLKKCGVQP